MPHWLQLMADSLPSLLWAGVTFTVPLTLLSFAFGLTLGLITALTRLFAAAPFAAVARFYVWVIRGTPLLVQLFVIFYGLPSIGILLDAFPAALIGFTLNIGAYSSEIIRAAISSMPKGQWEAAYSIGMSWRQTMIRTILPQAARVAVPPLSNTFISLVKDTSLAAARGAYQRRDAAFLHAQADVMEHGGVAETLVDVAELDHAFVSSMPP